MGKTQKAKWLISGYNRQPDALYTEVKKSMEKYGKVKKVIKNDEKWLKVIRND